MRDAVIVNPFPENSLLIVPNDTGAGSTLYHAVLTENVYELKTKPLDSVPSDSTLVLSAPHADRLRAAEVHVIVSAQSGAGLATTTSDNILTPLFTLLGVESTVHTTTSKTSHSEYLESTVFSRVHENIIVILGGDTIIYDLLNALPKNNHLTPAHRFTICAIPCGTGNALAMSLGTKSIPIGISKVFGVSESNAVHNTILPVMKISIRESQQERTIWGAVVCSWGLHASLVADSDDPEMRKQHGANRFAVAAERLLSPAPHIYHGTLRISDLPLRDLEHTYLLVSHVSHLETTFPIAPNQSPLDSTVTVVEIGPMTGEGLMNVMQAVYGSSMHLGMPGVRFMEGVNDVSFTVEEEDARWRRVCIDGDIITVEKGTEISLKLCQGIEINGGVVSLSIVN